MKNYPSNQLRWLWFSFFVLLLDQATKWLAQTHLSMLEPVNIAPILNLTLTHNAGAAFGFLSSADGWQQWLFIGIALVIGLGIVRWLYRLPRHENWLAYALALVLGGAIGNLLDRVLQGSVVDFIQVHYKDWYFPTFNLADSAITLGVIIWLLVELKKYLK